MDSSAIGYIGDLAVKAQKANLLQTHTPTILLRNPDGPDRVESLERYQATRSRYRGTFATTSLQDFARYVIARVGGEGFIDPDHMAATVIFNLSVDSDGNPVSSPALPGHGDHRATLSLKQTPEYAALHSVVSAGRRSQKDMVEWLEDWSDHLEADYPESTAPSAGSDPTRMVQAIAALRKLKIKAGAEAVHTDKDYGASKSSLEEVEASSDVGLPRGFRFTCKPCEDLDERTFYVRLGVIPDPNKPAMLLRWPRRDTDVEAVGQNFKAKLLDVIGDKATMLLGSFDPT